MTVIHPGRKLNKAESFVFTVLARCSYTVNKMKGHCVTQKDLNYVESHPSYMESKDMTIIEHIIPIYLKPGTAQRSSTMKDCWWDLEIGSVKIELKCGQYGNISHKVGQVIYDKNNPKEVLYVFLTLFKNGELITEKTTFKIGDIIDWTLDEFIPSRYVAKQGTEKASLDHIAVRKPSQFGGSYIERSETCPRGINILC